MNSRLRLREAGLAAPLVVTRPDKVELVRALLATRKLEALLVVNPRPELGQTSSLRAGLARLPPGARAFLIYPVDFPLVTAQDVDRLCAAFADAGETVRVVAPSFQGRRGHPVVVDAALAPEFGALPDEGSARTVLAADAVSLLLEQRDRVLAVPGAYHAIAGAREHALDLSAHERLVFLCSFQKEESVLLDMLFRAEPRARVFAIDTHYLFPETYELWRQVERRYDTKIEVFEGPSAEELAATHGERLWEQKPDLYLAVAKVEPLVRAAILVGERVFEGHREEGRHRPAVPRVVTARQILAHRVDKLPKPPLRRRAVAPAGSDQETVEAVQQRLGASAVVSQPLPLRTPHFALDAVLVQVLE